MAPRMPRNILIVKTSSLGDVIHNLPAISDIRANRSDVRIDWAVEEAYAPLVAMHPAIDRVIPVAIRRWRKQLGAATTWREFRALRRTLAERDYDMVIDTQGLLKSAIIAFLAANRRFGFDRASAREPFASRFYTDRIGVTRDVHATARCRTLVARALGYAVLGPVDYGIDAPAQSSNGSTTNEIVLLHGTARAEKEWPEAAWIELAQRLTAQDTRVLLLRGTERESARSERIASAVPQARVADRMDLAELAGVIGRTRAVIGVDTGLLHLAAALRVPAVGIFGVTDPRLTGPVGAGLIAVCRAASTIGVDEVLAALATVQRR
jgi:heptosyltransferase I